MGLRLAPASMIKTSGIASENSSTRYPPVIRVLSSLRPHLPDSVLRDRDTPGRVVRGAGPRALSGRCSWQTMDGLPLAVHSPIATMVSQESAGRSNDISSITGMVMNIEQVPRLPGHLIVLVTTQGAQVRL